MQAEYTGGEAPSPTQASLVELAAGVAERGSGAAVISTSQGICTLGIYGAAVVIWKDCDYVQVWVLSDGKHFVLATHTCLEPPSEAEIDGAERLVLGLAIRDD